MCVCVCVPIGTDPVVLVFLLWSGSYRGCGFTEFLDLVLKGHWKVLE